MHRPAVEEDLRTYLVGVQTRRDGYPSAPWAGRRDGKWGFHGQCVHSDDEAFSDVRRKI